MNVCIVGSGYVGLTCGACFAELSHKVICVDNDKKKLESLKKGIVPFFEPGLEGLVKKNLSNGNLSFSTDISSSVAKSDVVFIAVGTPSKPNGEADLSFVENVAAEIGKAIKKYTVVVEKSTVPVDTGEMVSRTIENLGIKKELFDVVSNPEFLKEGNAINDFLFPDRIVIGTNSLLARKLMKELYASIKAPMIFTDIKSAEIIKHAANSFLATKISFINAISRICELSGADINEVARGIGLDKRIGSEFLRAGLGYGGSCFPKDVSAFIKISEKKGYDFRLLKEVERINHEQAVFFLEKIKDSLRNIKGKRIAILGLSFKPETDDIRDAPSLKVIGFLLEEQAIVSVFDPRAMENMKKVFPSLAYCSDEFEAAKGADALLFLTEWDSFNGLDLKRLKNELSRPLVIDGRNIFDPKKMQEHGFEYVGIGRKLSQVM